MTRYTVSFTIESGLTAEAVKSQIKQNSYEETDLTVTEGGRAVHVTDEEQVATGRSLPSFLDDGCPECGCTGFRTTVTRSIGENYHVEGGEAVHTSTDDLIDFVGYAFAQCQDCSTTFIEDAELVPENVPSEEE